MSNEQIPHTPADNGVPIVNEAVNKNPVIVGLDIGTTKIAAIAGQ